MDGILPAAPPHGFPDGRGRLITDLRLAVTPRCTAAAGPCPSAPLVGRESALSRREARRLVTVLMRLGLRSVRFTGGEPALRSDLVDLVADARAAGLARVGVSTGGWRLRALVPPLAAAGVAHLAVVLPTLHPRRFDRIAVAREPLAQLLRGIDAAAGRFPSLEINVPVIAGVNDDELGALARLAWGCGALPRFISGGAHGSGEPPADTGVGSLLERQGVRLAPDVPAEAGNVERMRGACALDGSCGRLVIVGRSEDRSCARCNHLRVAHDGTVEPCPGGWPRASLRRLVRSRAGDDVVAEMLRDALVAPDRRLAAARA